MALHVPKAPGFAQMLKDGARHYSGLEEAVYRNIQACKQLAETTRTAYGPFGMNKMVINHLEKLFVTSDAATIVRELEVQHPAARMVLMASEMQEREVGDGTNLVLLLSGALLEQADSLLRSGLSVPEVIAGYEKACDKALEVLPSLSLRSLGNERDELEVAAAIRTAVSSKMYGTEDFLAKLIASACVSILPSSGNFNVDNVRVCKILGSGVQASTVMRGMVFKREVEGDVKAAKAARIAIYSCPFDSTNTETKGTVLIRNAQELVSLTQGDESLLESQVVAIASAGATVVVAGGKVADLALHYANKHGLMLVRLNSKWDLRRLSKTVGATVLPRLTPPTADDLGHCDSVHLDEVGDTQVVVFKQDKEESAISTVLLRGATENVMDDAERAVDDGVNSYKVLLRDRRLVPGAGATEIELAQQIAAYGEASPGLDQYAIKKFAVALESVPRALAENAGVKATEVLSLLYAAHQHAAPAADTAGTGDTAGSGVTGSGVGIDIEGEGPSVLDANVSGIVEPLLLKHWALKLATNAATTVLSVDQIIMAKRAGGPKAPEKKADWDEDRDTAE